MKDKTQDIIKRLEEKGYKKVPNGWQKDGDQYYLRIDIDPHTFKSYIYAEYALMLPVTKNGMLVCETILENKETDDIIVSLLNQLIE